MIQARVKFDPRDLYVGIHWNVEHNADVATPHERRIGIKTPGTILHLYLAILPTIVLHLRLGWTDPAQVVMCEGCGQAAPTLAEAVTRAWQDIDLEGDGFRGICPTCWIILGPTRASAEEAIGTEHGEFV